MMTRTLSVMILAMVGMALADTQVPAGKNKPAGLPASEQESSAVTKIPDGTGSAFQELNFEKTFIIEGKVEKPQVQFTLLKEPPPEKELKFETSFLQNILKLDRENTFKLSESLSR